LPEAIRGLIRDEKNEMAAGLIQRYPMQVLNQWMSGSNTSGLDFIVRTLSQIDDIEYKYKAGDTAPLKGRESFLCDLFSLCVSYNAFGLFIWFTKK
jgi:hypothetical protein